MHLKAMDNNASGEGALSALPPGRIGLIDASPTSVRKENVYERDIRFRLNLS